MKAFTANILISFLASTLVSIIFIGTQIFIKPSFFLNIVQGIVLYAGLFVILWIFFASIISFYTRHYFIAPLRRAREVMESFAQSGTTPELFSFESRLEELQKLESAVAMVIQRAQITHKKDEEISRVKSDFISTAAHQFRTPLTGVRWALEALAKEPLTKDQLLMVASANDKVKDLVTIMSTLLNISSIESGKHQYHFAPTDIHALTDEVVEGFKKLALDKRITLYYVPQEKPLALAKADREQIKWILNNLVENAIVYTPPDGTVRVFAENTEERVFVYVSDTGIGIPNSDRANIFERFYRAQNAIAKENAGNGLGLYIARTIATDHGGDLRFISNEPNPGTTFVLSLPLAK